VTTTSSVITISRWPATEHQPSSYRPHDADVHGRGGARREPAAGRAAVQHQVVHRDVGVGDLDDEPVAGGHLDAVGDEPHVLRLDLDRRGAAGGGGRRP